MYVWVLHTTGLTEVSGLIKNNLGVPQGSVLGPLLFNTCISKCMVLGFKPNYSKYYQQQKLELVMLFYHFTNFK